MAVDSYPLSSQAPTHVEVELGCDKKLHNDLDENKEEVHYLRNKWEYKRDMIDDLEDKIKKRMMNVRN